MGLYTAQDTGALARAVDANASANSGAPSVITAGAGLDNLKVTGATINRIDGNRIAQSCKVVTHFLAALADTETLSLAIEEQQSADGSSWDTATVVEAAAIVATSDGGTNERGTREYDIDLTAKKQYVRYNVTPDLSASGTDTASFATVVVLGGFDKNPVTDSVV